MFRRTILVTLVLASLFATSFAAIEAENYGENQTGQVTPGGAELPEESTAVGGAGVTATTLIVVVVLALVVVALVVALVARKP